MVLMIPSRVIDVSIKPGAMHSRQYYQRKREQNKVHTQALLAVARKQVDVVWALIRDNRIFTPESPGRSLAA